MNQLTLLIFYGGLISIASIVIGYLFGTKYMLHKLTKKVNRINFTDKDLLIVKLPKLPSTSTVSKDTIEFYTNIASGISTYFEDWSNIDPIPNYILFPPYIEVVVIENGHTVLTERVKRKEAIASIQSPVQLNDYMNGDESNA